jgi:hypothetical protein
MGKELTLSTQEKGKCTGGRSWGCRHDEHEKGKFPDVLCYRCKVRMGCSRCCERASQLICLECYNWATKGAVRIHGNVVPNIKVPRVRIDAGWITHSPLTDEVNRLLDD